MAAMPGDERHRNAAPTPLRRPRLRIQSACKSCRQRKAKCDGGRPECARCNDRGKTCSYDQDPLTPPTANQRTRRTPRKDVPIRSRPPGAAPLPTPPSPVAGVPLSIQTQTVAAAGRLPTPESTQEGLDPETDTDQKGVYYTAHGRFSGEIAAAIDERAGIAQTDTSSVVPFVNAPLFGNLDLSSAAGNPSPSALPPREYADRLISIYWKHVDPTEPVLDRDVFSRNYDSSYSTPPGNTPNDDTRIWLSILNVVFSLAVQRQECTPSHKRCEESSLYFRRSWTLLRPETVLWHPGSLELVQCLMLMSRYLHCTDNRHLTWMTAGLAARIAQSTCCHPPEGTVDSPARKKLRRRVWESCLHLDRCVAWSLGRTPSLIAVPNKVGSEGENSGGLGRQFGLELLELGYQIQLAQTQTRNGLALKLGLPRLYQQDEYHAAAVQLDDCLNKWEEGFPDEWRVRSPGAEDGKTRAKAYFLRLRILHTRIFLYRPILASFYKTRSRTVTVEGASGPPSLSDRLLRECAAMCIEAAQSLTSLIADTHEPGADFGLFPWWYRIYYLHIAGTNFLAAMFAPELFTQSVRRSWDGLMSALRGHEHLSTYVAHCIWRFETLSSRILEARGAGGGAGGDGVLGCVNGLYEDIFQDISFDFDDPIFGPEMFL